MSELPKGWMKTNLGVLAAWGAGGTPSRSNKSYYNGDIPWIKTGDLGPRYLKNVGESITEEGLNNSSAKIFSKGSVAIAMYGATIGKTSILEVDAATNQACAVASPVKGVNRNWLYFLLNNEKESFIKKGKGGAQPNISQTIIKEHSVNLPPLNEQARIANKLDNLLAKVDNAQARLEKVPSLLKRFRQSVLASATSGDLTELFRNKEMFASLGSIASIATDIRYGTSKKCSYTEGKTPVLRIPNIGEGDIIQNDLKFSDFDEKELSKLSLEEGDLLIIRSNGSVELVGKTAVVSSKDTHCLFAGYLIRLRLNLSRIIPKFAGICLQSPQLREVMELKARSTSGINNINSKEIASLEIPIPPLEEQTEIVRRVESLFALADTVEKQYQAAKKRLDRLTQSILAKAFRGELVPQDPNDEPASELLKRIQVEREAQAAANKSKPKRSRSKKQVTTI